VLSRKIHVCSRSRARASRARRGNHDPCGRKLVLSANARCMVSHSLLTCIGCGHVRRSCAGLRVLYTGIKAVSEELWYSTPLCEGVHLETLVDSTNHFEPSPSFDVVSRLNCFSRPRISSAWSSISAASTIGRTRVPVTNPLSAVALLCSPALPSPGRGSDMLPWRRGRLLRLAGRRSCRNRAGKMSVDIPCQKCTEVEKEPPEERKGGTNMTRSRLWLWSARRLVLLLLLENKTST